MSSDKLVIGLTGGVGSGKTVVGNLFAERGIEVIDTDVLARKITAPDKPCLKLIIDKFGTNFLNSDLTLDRKKLGKYIFNHPNERIWLEELLHPQIRNEMSIRIKQSHSPYCIVAIPLLVETKPNPEIDRVLVVDTTCELQVARAEARDMVTKEEINSILKAQATRAQRLEKANDVILNIGSLADLIPQVEKLHQFYLKLSGN